MIPDRAIAHVLRPLADPLPPALEQRGRKIREALEGLDAKDRLELACRTVLGVLMTARPRFRGGAGTRLQHPLRRRPSVAEARNEALAVHRTQLRCVPTACSPSALTMSRCGPIRTGWQIWIFWAESIYL